MKYNLTRKEFIKAGTAMWQESQSAVHDGSINRVEE